MKANGSEDENPCWLLLPQWLYGSVSLTARRRLGHRFLADICRAQYAAFLAIRLHDDLFDGQSRDRRDIYVGDRCLILAEELFASHVPPSFWPLFRTAIATTIEAIVEVDDLQRAGRGSRRALDLYARVGEVFTLGASAVCLATGRERRLHHVRAFLAEVSVISQVFDDLSDLQEDSRRGRTNIVSSFTGVTGAHMPWRSASRLVAELRRRAARARVAAGQLRLADAIAYADGLDASVNALEAAFQQTRVFRGHRDASSAREAARLLAPSRGSISRRRDVE